MIVFIGNIGAFVLWILKGRKTKLIDELEASHFEFKYDLVGFITVILIFFLLFLIFR